MPRTIEDINVADDGGLVSVTQYGTKTGSRSQPIPVDRLVAYVHDREGGNWRGRSLLRTCYKNWLLKDRALRGWSQALDRNGMGVPVYEGAEGETDLSHGLGLARSVRAGSEAGAAIPQGAKLRLMGVEGAVRDHDPHVRYQDEQIARAVLAHFLNLGTQTGSWALGTTFADFFTLSLQTLAQQIADVTTQHVIEDLVDVNYGVNEPAPRLVFQEIGSRRDASAEAIKVLVESGVIRTDRDLEEFVRDVFGLPAKGRLTPPGAEPVAPVAPAASPTASLIPTFQAPPTA
jgi:phage gp29-like protein